MNAGRIVIVGAGHAGCRAALAARQAGFAGDITLVAAEGSELPYERPPLSKWSEDSDVSLKPIIPAEAWQKAAITCVSEQVDALDKDAKALRLADGTTLPYDRLLLAIGASPRRLSPAVAADASVHYLRDLADAQRLRANAKTAKSALIIGGGFIGLELAASLRGMDIAVHVIEVADRLLARAVTQPVADIIHQLHVENGVTFSFGQQVVSVSDGNVTLNNGTTLSADLIIAGIGSVPNTALGESAGLLVDNGIIVDTHMRTSDPDIFAAGDCCRFPLFGDAARLTRLESWQAAGDQGALAARNMISDADEDYVNVPWFWSNQYDHVMQVAGLPNNDHVTTVERPYGPDHHISFGVKNNGTLAFATGIAASTKIAKDIRFASKLIEAQTRVTAEALSDPTTALKSLLRS